MRHTSRRGRQSHEQPSPQKLRQECQCMMPNHSTMRVREDKCTLPRATDKAEERANKVPRHTWFPHHALASTKSTTSKRTTAVGSALWCSSFSHSTHPTSAPASAQDAMTPKGIAIWFWDVGGLARAAHTATCPKAGAHQRIVVFVEKLRRHQV